MAGQKKPWYRIRNIILAFVLLIVVMVGWQVIFALTARPGAPRDVNPDLRRIVETYAPEGVEPGQGQEIIAELKPVLDDIEKDLQERFDPDDLVSMSFRRGDDGRPVLTEAGAERLRLFDENGGPEIVERLTNEPSLGMRHMDGLLLEILLPELGATRRLARVLGSQMTVAATAGDFEAAAARLDDLLHLAELVSQQPVLISHLVGWAIVDLGLNELRTIMTEHDLTTAQCERFVAVMDRRLPLPSPVMAIEGERLVFQQIADVTHTDDGRGSGRFLLSELGNLEMTMGASPPTLGGAARIVNMAHIVMPSKKETLDLANEHYDGYAELFEMPRSKRDAKVAELEAFIQQRDLRMRLLQVMLPALGRVADTYDGIQMRIDGTRVMLAIEARHAATGAYPDDLDALTPTYIDDLPNDPYSGQTFGYRRLNAPDAATGATGYLLWSAGFDGESNDGTPVLVEEYDDDGNESMAVSNSSALNRDNAETDFILNLPRQYEE
ncbi:MAG: hypothetical protein RIB58_04340 [Phycisphaerales bacterium]